MTKKASSFAAKEVYRITQAMLSGDMVYLLGCKKLVELREALGVYENDPDFFAFVAVQPMIFELNVDWGDIDSTLRENPALRSEFADVDAWAKEHSLSHCESLHHRYQSHA